MVYNRCFSWLAGSNDHNISRKNACLCKRTLIIFLREIDHFSQVETFDLNVLRSDRDNTLILVVRSRFDHNANGNPFTESVQIFDRPLSFIDPQIPEHLQKDRLGEVVEERDGLAALLPEQIGLIQDRRNPLLLIERRERNFETFQQIGGNAFLACTAGHALSRNCPEFIVPQKIKNVFGVYFPRWANNMKLG